MAKTRQERNAAKQAQKRGDLQKALHINMCQMITKSAKALADEGRFSEIIAHQVAEVFLKNDGSTNYKFSGSVLAAPLVAMTRDEFIRFMNSNSHIDWSQEFDDEYFEEGYNNGLRYMVTLHYHLNDEDQKQCTPCRTRCIPSKKVVEEMMLSLPALQMAQGFNEANRNDLFKKLGLDFMVS
jgi:hypothetical protein